ncbi:protein bicaudal D isoform X2 [Neocloeon triangulifer]|uniref:protein bicaudal D isoform X2 n=1 Tax=Neocloeon triangulifer TaxID=2078957 RepID=UPI00286EDFE5|nr:protein bicaudal D isoform X2 [Neocloeon triangulifer]
MATLDELKLEVERLTRELDQAVSEKIQSAQYGLVLLEEKQALEQKVEELDNMYENTRSELEITQEALTKFQTTHKVTTMTGIEQEESLLSESAMMENSLNSQILDLENETKFIRAELERVKAEKERMISENNNLIKSQEEKECERKQLRCELREIKSRETSLLTEYSELEEENITLQKQVSALKSNQVEFEGVKHEARRLGEDVDLLHQQVNELSCLKKIAEKQLEEALNSLQAEREAKYALKKELDQRMNSQSMYNLSNLALSIRGLAEGSGLGSDGEEDELPELRRIEADLQSDENAPKNKDNKQVDLFSEIHLNELQRLEKAVEQAETDKQLLTQSLRDAQGQSEKSQAELQGLSARIATLSAHVESLLSLKKRLLPDGVPPSDVVALKDWCALSSQEIQELQKQLADLESGLNFSETAQQLREDIANLKGKLLDAEQRARGMSADSVVLAELTAEASKAFDAAQTGLSTTCDELATLYHHVCTVNGETPSRVMLDHEKHLNEDGKIKAEETENKISCRLDEIRSKLQAGGNTAGLEGLCEAANLARSVETALDQVRHLSKAVYHTLEQGKGSRTEEVSRDSAEADDLSEQVIKLKALLSTKREQIATLRTVIKSNKNTAEVALTNLKSKYETEKAIVNETMTKLRNELRVLKEDAATFSSLRAMFAARCEEYVTQVDELQRQLAAAEDEKKTLNQLLRLAVQQKLGLTQRLEELEVDREMRNARGRHVQAQRGAPGPGRVGNRPTRPHRSGAGDFF